MEVDEAYPGPSRAPESLNADTDASGVSSRQAKDDEPASVDATLGNETGDAACSERHGRTEDAWHTVLSRRQKKLLKKQQSQMEKAVKANEKFESYPPAEKQKREATQGFRQRKRRGPPPLLKEDIKIILRPHKGLWVKNILGLELSRAVIDACQRSFNGNDFLLRVHPGSNVEILSMPSMEVASRLHLGAR
ncbi:hypothetical protein HPB51_019547 [Rhipicephalus microplus]|uniref:Uncharacterized protein n=1 Tax=Rhipicephalus microplus TaxID=6941 RepID=A0A9J6F8C7_RHIMP|nr:hypothetical protein HPB51_019547 [Rhipicephalus microplus]